MKTLYTVIFFFFRSLLVAQTSIIITADKDNTIFSEAANSNGAGADFFYGATSGGALRRGLLHFNLSSVPAGVVITSASLKFFVNRVPSGSNALEPAEAYKLLNDWGEGASNSGGAGTGAPAATNDVTWTTRFTGTPGNWINAGGDFTTTMSGAVQVNITGPYSITGAGMATDVQSWVDNPSTNFGWIMKANEAITRNARRVSSKENVTVTERPTLTLVYSTPLPVTLKTFSALLHQQNILLQWQTATEIDNDFFSIEHSANGKDFSELMKIKGAGNSVLPKDYSYTHFNVNAGKHFYRLAQHDLNGRVQYSQIVFVGGNAKRLLLQLSPNPVRDIIDIKANAQLTGLPYKIMNTMGQVVITGVLSSQQINVYGLPMGTYQLQIKKKTGEKLAASFVKQ